MTLEKTWYTLQDTFRMSIYNSFITIKYNRLASPLETVPQPYKAGWQQHLILFFSLFFKFLVPLIVVLKYMPKQYRPEEAWYTCPTNSDGECETDTNYEFAKKWPYEDISHKLVYGITNDINYLSYLKFFDYR